MENPLPIQPSDPVQEPESSRRAPEPDGGWYRLALLLTGDAAAAAAIFENIFAIAPDELAQLRGRDRRKRWLLGQIRARALQWRETNVPAASASLPGRVSALPEPSRSVFAFFHCVEGSLDDLAEMLALSRAAFSKALAKARAALAPEGAVFPENALLRVHRPWAEDRRRVAKAVRAVEASPEPEATAPLAAQIAADRAWHAEIGAIAIPPELVARYRAVPPRPRLLAQLFQPAVLAIALALVVVVGVGVYLVRTRGEDFQGREAIETMLSAEADAAGPSYEAVTAADAGKLDDWFVLKGFDGYSVPPPFDKAKAMGVRVWNHGNVPVAEVALRKIAGIEGVRLLVFRASGIPKGVAPGAWRVFPQDEWAVAVWSDGETVCVAVLKGDVDDMQTVMRTLSR